jgi:curved DNA-binding protein CbpA
MYSTNDILGMIKTKQINPYEILNINCKVSDINFKEILRKQYKKKALLLHPDKNNGKTDIEFKIVSISYKFLLKLYEKQTEDFKKYHQALSTNSEYKTSRSSRESDATLKSYYDNSFAKISDKELFKKSDFRKNYFVDDTQIDESDYLDSKKKEKKYSSYQDALLDSKIQKLLFKKGEKFDINKFNKLFDLLKQKNEKQLVKCDIKDLVPMSSIGITNLHEIYHIESAETVIHDPKKTKKTYTNLVDYKKEPELCLTEDLVEKVNKMKIKKNKIKPLSKTEIKDKIQKNRKLDISESEKETLEEYHIRNANNYAKHQSEGTLFLEQNKHIFPKAIQNKINLQLKNSGLYYIEN